jgi:25S rRNA (uracil2843-N3)-methyltransferase
MKEQTSLDLLSSTFSSALQSPLLSGSLRSLKRHLYNRSFADAFPTSSGPRDGAEDQNALMLEAYVVRWVPTRALCYSRIIGQVAKYLQKSDLRVVCIGAGCGSETLALQSSLSCECTIP